MRTHQRLLSPHAGPIALLLALALWLPLPLYLVSLALFGLPHIVMELAFLRSRYGARWPKPWWFGLGAVLLLQALARAGTWLGSYPADLSRIVDVLSLFLLCLMVALAPMQAGWRVRLVALVLAGGVMWLLNHGDLVAALLLLAIAHNFTPLAMAWDLARAHRPARQLAWFITAMLMLPLLVAFSGWGGGVPAAALAGKAWTLDGQLPADIGLFQRQALVSAIVLAQCLHYYCVIVLLPAAEQGRIGRPVTSPPLVLGLLAAVLLLLAYYFHDFSGARQLYAVAAGFHAWLEWPLLLMACLCVQRRA